MGKLHLGKRIDKPVLLPNVCLTATRDKGVGTTAKAPGMLALHITIWGDFSGFHRRAHPGSAEIHSAGQEERSPQSRKRKRPFLFGF